MAEKRRTGGVERAVRAELRALGVSVATSGNAAMAVSLARQMDISRNGVPAATAAAQVRGLLDDVRRAAEAAKPRESELDDLRARRAARRATG